MSVTPPPPNITLYDSAVFVKCLIVYTNYKDQEMIVKYNKVQYIPPLIRVHGLYPGNFFTF